MSPMYKMLEKIYIVASPDWVSFHLKAGALNKVSDQPAHMCCSLIIQTYLCVFFFVFFFVFFLLFLEVFIIQSTLVILNSKGLSETFRDICTPTYQICRIEEKIIRITTFNKYICNWTHENRDILKILWKRGETAPKEKRRNCSLGAISPLFHNSF